MFTIGVSQLCFCKQPPRVLLDGYAVCRCAHLIYHSTGPVTPWSPWTSVTNPGLRAELVQRAKTKIGHLDEAALGEPTNVRAAVEAARLADENGLANDLEYEQWVASL